jgi:6-pyruvoyltetrahydropterin/6-carboxytetrahydropterin synthase
MRLTRVYRFAASHRLHANTLSEDDNVRLYGKCNNPFGHGHNYAVHLAVTGEVNESTGRLIDIGALDRYVRQQVIEAFDHRDLSEDVTDFDKVVPTTENLALAIERRLRNGWPDQLAHARLDSILIEETAKNTFELRTT